MYECVCTVCVFEPVEQPGTAHRVTNEADTQCSAITVRCVMIHYLAVIFFKKEGNIHTNTDTHIPKLMAQCTDSKSHSETVILD